MKFYVFKAEGYFPQFSSFSPATAYIVAPSLEVAVELVRSKLADSDGKPTKIHKIEEVGAVSAFDVGGGAVGPL